MTMDTSQAIVFVAHGPSHLKRWLLFSHPCPAIHVDTQALEYNARCVVALAKEC